MSENGSVRDDSFRLGGRGGDPPSLDGAGKLGGGWMTEGQKDMVRDSLIRDLEAKGLAEPSSTSIAVLDEVERFLDNGRVSGTNLNRLERRIRKRLDQPGTPLSARDQRSAISEFSVGSASPRLRTPRSLDGGLHTPLGSGIQSPGSAPRSPGGANSARGGLAVNGLQAIAETNPKWSEMARYAKRQETAQKVQDRCKIKTTREKMRQDLELQMQEKKDRNLVFVHQDRQLHEKQTEELKAWKEAEIFAADEQVLSRCQMKKDLEMQCQTVRATREEERRKNFAEDHLQAKRTAEQFEQEKKAAAEKKDSQRNANRNLMIAQKIQAEQHEIEQKQRAVDEKIKVLEYQKMVDEQEASNKRNIPVARQPMGEYRPPNKAEMKRMQKQEDERMLVLIRAANNTAAEAETQKQDNKKKERYCHREYLFQQISDKDITRNTKVGEKQQLKVSAEEATAEFMEAEKQRLAQQRMKNMQHRIELEKQIESKKPPTRFQKRYFDDQMSAAEVACNWRLLEEARNS